jgi:hypothetical protein
MLSEVTVMTQDLIEYLAVNATPVHSEIAKSALVRAADFFGDLHSVSGKLWDARSAEENLVLGKFTFSTVAGLLPGTTLEQHGVLEHHARNVLGVLDDQYVVDRIEQVKTGRPVLLMGYISGGTTAQGQISLQLNPELMYKPEKASDRIYNAVAKCAATLIEAGFDPAKPVAFHAEINNRKGFSQTRKKEYDFLKALGLPEKDLPPYKGYIYLTMPHVLALNEDLVTPEYQLHDLEYWARQAA